MKRIFFIFAVIPFFALGGPIGVKAGPVASFLESAEVGEEVWAVTLFFSEMRSEGAPLKVGRIKADLSAWPSDQKSEMVLACFAKGDMETQVNACNLNMSRILQLLDEGNISEVWNGPISPRFVTSTLDDQGADQTQREAIEIRFLRIASETAGGPSDPVRPAGDDKPTDEGEEPRVAVAKILPLAVEPPVTDPQPTGPWLEGNAAVKLAAHGFTLAPTLAPPTIALTAPNRARADAASVDFWFSIHPTWTVDGPQTLAALTGETDIALAVHLTKDLDGLLIWTGAGAPGRIDHPFERGRPYHVAVRAGPDETRIHINGDEFATVLQNRFADARSRAPQVQAATLGALPLADGNQAFAFAGFIGKFRSWDSFLSDGFAPFLLQMPVLDSLNRFGTSLTVSTAWDGGEPRLVETPAFLKPRPGWWRQVGMGETRIHNIEAFAEELEHPSFSPLHQAIRRPADELKTTAEQAAFRQVSGLGQIENHPQFSHHPLYKIALHEGVIARDNHPVDRSGAVMEPYGQTYYINNVSAVKASYGDKDELATLYFLDCEAHERNPDTSQPVLAVGIDSGRFEQEQAEGRKVCEAEPERRDRSWFWLGKDEEIRGLTYTHGPGGGLTNVYVHTSLSTFGPLLSKALPRLPDGQSHVTRRVFLDDGMPFVGLTVGVGDARVIDGLGFAGYPDGADLMGLVLYAEGGAAQRFHHLWPNTFFAMTDNPAVTPYGQSTIRVVNDRLIYVTGIDSKRTGGDFRTDPVAFEWVGAEPTVKPVDTYNNTFVSLSKAVNLQANYVGYDIVAMDPLHLTRTGADMPVFKQPDGDSNDYYDANRIFVPRGLRYVPEFTGRVHRTVHDTTTYSEFKNALSKSVNAGFDSKALPSFSLSNTMSNAHETMSEDRKMKSVGLTRVVLYDLILEKQEIALSDVFRRRVAALAQDGDYAGFIESFGTHYPTAVVYGGMGVLEIDMTEKTRSSLLQNGVDTKTEISLMIHPKTETGIKFGSEKQSESAKLFRDITSTEDEDFYWVGGAHMGTTAESWGVGEDGAVPIHVTLRRMDELLSPLFFDDPDVTVRVRRQLAIAIDRHIQFAGLGLQDVSAGQRQGYVEIRMDRVFCGSPPTDPNLTSFVTHDSGSDQLLAPNGLLPESTNIYPMLHFEGYDGENRQLRNFAADLTDGAENHNVLSATCNTRDNILPKSPFLTSTDTARFAMDLDDIFANGHIRLIDNRDSEHEVLYPRFNPDKKDQIIDAIEVGATLGIKYLWDEYVGDGSLTGKGLNPDAQKQPPAPSAETVNLWAYTLFCDTPGQSPCPSVDRDAIAASAGVWRQRTMTMAPTGPNCGYCKPHVIGYSVRYIQ